MDLLRKLFNALLKVEKAIGGLLLFVMLAVTFIATVGRYTYLYRVLFSEELARFCMIWLVFIGAAVSGWNGNLFNVDLIAPRLPRTGKVIFFIIKMLLTVAFCAFAAKYGFAMIERQIKLKQRSAMMGVPYSFMYSSVPIGSILIAIHYSIRTILDIFDLYKTNDKPEAVEGDSV